MFFHGQKFLTGSWRNRGVLHWCRAFGAGTAAGGEIGYFSLLSFLPPSLPPPGELAVLIHLTALSLRTSVKTVKLIWIIQPQPDPRFCQQLVAELSWLSKHGPCCPLWEMGPYTGHVLCHFWSTNTFLFCGGKKKRWWSGWWSLGIQMWSQLCTAVACSWSAQINIFKCVWAHRAHFICKVPESPCMPPWCSVSQRSCISWNVVVPAQFVSLGTGEGVKW